MSKHSQCEEEQFLKDVSDHEMQILHEDGIYRHVRFKRPDTSCMHFDLITYPGYLVYSGDMGCFVFSRLRDMFEFFRTDRQYQKGDGLKINTGYWAEKLQAVDGNRSYVEGVKEFDEEKFTRNVMEHLVTWIRNHADQTTKEERRELWDEVINEVVHIDGDSAGHRQQVAAHDFTHRVNKEVGEFYFQDFFERDCTCYTHRFIWCCYALAWGINKYDESKPGEFKLAREMIEAYGGQCSCCGERRHQFLQLDHIENDGYLDRKIHRTSTKLFAHLKKAGWPKDRYQLLCANCNFGKLLNGGVCPHKESNHA